MKLLPEYKGQIIKIKGSAGLITFDTNKAIEADYPLYHSIGFDFCFEEQKVTYKEPIHYKGIEQDVTNVDKVTKGNKKKDAKKGKAESEKE